MSHIKSFRELKVWQKAHQFVLEVYRITKDFPNQEKYALVVQLRRAVVSVASNIVEGFSRLSIKEGLRFYNIATASLEEVKYQLLIAKDINYLTDESYQKVSASSEEVSKMLARWIQSQIKIVNHVAE